MSLETMSVSPRPSHERRFPPRRRADGREREAEARPEPFEPAAEAPSRSREDAIPYANRFKADLTSLSVLARGGGDASPARFLGDLARLLVSVGSGDHAQAEAAARALRGAILAMGGEPSEGRAGSSASAHIFEDFSKLIHAAEFGDLGAADVAANDLALDLRGAFSGAPVVPSSPGAVSPAGAAYETLMGFMRDPMPSAA